MNRPPAPRNPRVEELLMKRALYGLDAAETEELRTLGEEGDTTFDLAAAATDLATIKQEPLPPALAAKIVAAALVGRDGHPVVPLGVVPSSAAPAWKRSRATWAGWLAAAACLLVAIGAWVVAARKPREVVVRVPEPAATVGGSRQRTLRDVRPRGTWSGARRRSADICASRGSRRTTAARRSTSSGSSTKRATLVTPSTGASSTCRRVATSSSPSRRSCTSARRSSSRSPSRSPAVWSCRSASASS